MGEDLADPGREATISVRVEQFPEPVVEGSEQRDCIDCGEPVWVSPSSLESVEAGHYPPHFLCVDCLGERDREMFDS